MENHSFKLASAFKERGRGNGTFHRFFLGNATILGPADPPVT
jgi:hypothetical protein